jgi:hypothetical protein
MVQVLRSAETDANRDGLVDRLDVEALMPLRAGEHIHAATLLLFLDVRLRSRARVQVIDRSTNDSR